MIFKLYQCKYNTHTHTHTRYPTTPSNKRYIFSDYRTSSVRLNISVNAPNNKMVTLNTQDEHRSAYPRSNIFLEVESGKSSNKTKKNIKKLLWKLCWSASLFVWTASSCKSLMLFKRMSLPSTEKKKTEYLILFFTDEMCLMTRAWGSKTLCFWCSWMKHWNTPRLHLQKQIRDIFEMN